jgi:hypothetical protein
VLNIDLAPGRKFGPRGASPVSRRCGGRAGGEFEFEFAGRVRLLLVSMSLEDELFFFPLSLSLGGEAFCFPLPLSPLLPPNIPMVLAGAL